MAIPVKVSTSSAFPVKARADGSYKVRAGEAVERDHVWYEGDYTVTPTEDSITLETDGKTMTDDLVVEAIDSEYVGSDVPRKTSSDLTASGATVTAPAGYYEEAASKSVASGTEGTPTASKGSVSNHTIAVTPSVTNSAGYIPGSTKTGTAVTVSASELVSGNKSITANGSNIDVTNYATASVNVLINNQNKTVTPTTSSQSVTADTGYTGLGTVTVNKIPDEYIIPTGTKEITSNGTGIDVTEYADVDVDVPNTYAAGDEGKVVSSGALVSQTSTTKNANGTYDTTTNNEVVISVPNTYTAGDEGKVVSSGALVSQSSDTVTANDTYDTTLINSLTVSVPGASLQAKTNISPTTSSQTIQPDSGYDGLSSVQINAMPSGSAGTPSATKGTVSSHSVSVTPSVTNTTGYITGGTKTGTAISVSASELVSGTYTVDSSGTKDVTNYASASVPSLTLPSSASSTSSGTSKATISRSTSDQYINIPTGFNNTAQYYKFSAVANGTAGTPTATKGTVSNHSVSVTPSVTNTTGYITGSTKTGTAVTVSASELVSGSETKTSNGTYDVTNLAELVVNVSGGSGGGVTVASKTASTSSNATSISFSSLSGKPTSFMCMLDQQSSLGSTRYVIGVTYDGTTVRGTWGYSSSNTRYAYYSNSYFTQSYSSGTLTITTNSSTNGGYFRSGYTYRLIYTY